MTDASTDSNDSNDSRDEPDALVAVDEVGTARVDEPARASQEARDSLPPPRRRWPRWAKWLGGVLSALIVLASVGALLVYVYFDEILAWLIKREAKKHGVDLAFSSVKLSDKDLLLSDPEIAMADVPGLKLTGRRLTLSLDGDWHPKRVAIDAPHIELEGAKDATVDAAQGSADIVDFKPKNVVVSRVTVVTSTFESMIALQKIALGDTLMQFAPRLDGLHLEVEHPVASTKERLSLDLEGLDLAKSGVAVDHVTIDAPSLAAVLAFEKVALSEDFVRVAPTVTGVHVSIKKPLPALPLPLEVDVDRITPTPPSKVTLRGAKLVLPIVGKPVDLDEISIETKGDVLTVAVPSEPELSLALDTEKLTVDVGLTKVTAEKLAKELGWSRPPGFLLTATARIDLSGANPTGAFQSTLEHYVPPHPVELNGIVFGDATKASGEFTMQGARVDLTKLHVAAGALVLDGTGKVTLEEGGRVDLDLSGSVACNALAVSAIGAHLGMGAALLTGHLAGGHITGSVGVHLTVTLRARDAAHPEIHPSAQLHCGLKIL
ncbi:MAG: hypothetical protein U0414_20215 [Polyangiaceae bacterium]